ncbi:hypothetical protein WS70_19170 [Burkholderia mayonis]|uniref:Uncharacterized protein n=1 Tax=Burkholderia mayonis TaxID=1385591 RepID=A0A1B4FK02_9BURK|nr:hypothetical protein WS70_19170 [Burkholderia mayonis]KVE37620.1 hypothetical protein WS69_10885 [Burkholderia sp. BDU5]KVE49258.1 hypothetical protein WS70_20550 [Burkholderia mayonis]
MCSLAALRACSGKLAALEADRPDEIVTENVGCESHLNGAGRTRVRHWIELVDSLHTPDHENS